MSETKFKKQALNESDGWHYIGSAGEPAFLNGWLNYGTLPSWVPLRFRKDAEGFVHVEGMVRAGTLNSNVFILPVGYRPNALIIYPMFSNDMGNVALGKIESGGYVNAEGLTANNWVGINVTFYAEG